MLSEYVGARGERPLEANRKSEVTAAHGYECSGLPYHFGGRNVSEHLVVAQEGRDAVGGGVEGREGGG